MNYRDIQKHHLLLAAATGIGLILLAFIGFSVIYAGKVYPGVTVNGIYLGGLDRGAAETALKTQAETYAKQQIPITYNRTTLLVPVSALGVTYDSAAVSEALEYGRTGSLWEQLHAKLRSLVGKPTTVTKYEYDDSELIPFVDHVEEDITRPVANARLTFDNDQVQVAPSQPGHRPDRGQLVTDINDRLAHMDDSPIKAHVYLAIPTIDEDNLIAARHRADVYAAAPLSLKVGSTNSIIDQPTILSWIDVSTPAGRTDMPAGPLYSFYTLPTDPKVNLTVNKDKVGVFVDKLADTVNQEARNAVLAMSDGKLAVVQPSRPSITLEENKAVDQIITALSRSADKRSVGLSIVSKPAEISESNLDSLGIKEQISEGQTFFPGSSPDRLTNVRTGAAKYQGVLLKPGEVFSFGKILGDVGPAQGYVPELVILDNKVEKQYGGGLCQVSSTAYRAALLAGLPILERKNHSYAVSYYTAPYGVPGVDATIYYPDLDFKFKNDTGSYILIQTHMAGTTLTFDFFGTKTKTGEIRGPQFVSGSNDATQPSHTVFWRDIKDPSGKVIKTDTIDTYYESSTKFHTQKQFN